MRFSKKEKPDYLLALIVVLLCFFGIVMISSASIVMSQEHFGNNYYYVTHQIISLIIGLILMIGAYFVDYRIWRKNSLILFLATLLLLIAVFIPGIGKEFGGAHRWIGIGPILFQPSELIKLTFIIYLASWLEKKGDSIKNFSLGFVPFLVLMVTLGFLIMNQPDLGTLSVILFTAVITFFIAGARLSHLALGGIIAAAIIGILIKTASYRFQRLLVFLNPREQTLGAAYHINQALIAVGSGGMWGLGFGQSKQKYLYLPQAHTDSIFAIIAEELGFIRSSIVIAAFVFLGIRGYKIAKLAPDAFSRNLAAGITTWFLIQAFINIAAMLNLVPLTGIPLPFISFGGSSLIFSLLAVGILLNISKYSK
ncbi:MAG: Stage V sporulation protein E [Berkelbacteria bacterium GW2011_GWB1_38_5]|uniref:Probable peptidoglycan glycosyltransferase FtsW n=2 Tax=Candidatus Berkelbacteria TaxID=1618330 RepID=A0A0G0LGM8_9BACT|nr:MAG: Stage V sporulation protein E [Berkelbacteria bacterium GW2011_GWB1_38_5]KKQ91048.1 MAG: Stage V sporulation protein E [Berkelbacteria bacterium GW2011_GWA1_39_10]